MISKIRDFIYNKNDILIAFLIMILAVAVIGWRVKALFDYPKQLVAGGGSETQTQQGTDPQSSQEEGTQTSGQTQGEQSTSAGAEQGSASGAAESSGSPGSSGDTGEETVPPASGAIPSQDDGSTWTSDGKLTRDFTITVKGSSATAAIQCLIDWEIFKDYAEYKEICQSLGLDDEKVSGGTFTFKKGLTKSEIAKTVNWS